MGLSHEQHQEQQRRLQPAITTTPVDKAEPTREDPTFGNEDLIRGIPLVGRVSGTMRGTRPGDPVSNLERDARDLNEAARAAVKAKMKAARDTLKQPPKR